MPVHLADQCLLGIRISNLIGCAGLELMQEQLVELGVRSFDLTAVNCFAAIEHVHEQVCIVRCRLNRIAENLYFTLSER